jgi:hypothetical protein
MTSINYAQPHIVLRYEFDRFLNMFNLRCFIYVIGMLQLRGHELFIALQLRVPYFDRGPVVVCRQFPAVFRRFAI